ncbi:hypothetical protein BZG36_00596 [Bifiguratus adelaidae]|uniref:Fork-head domain-containing protein n=1 Tax=Bifiguratus adelaidae TaxID=1938954 RepID=A0A261Y790_9FUNG|nr:hypothetical protein BZG36_00596 [Bifiguratus adelaidae]
MYTAAPQHAQPIQPTFQHLNPVRQTWDKPEMAPPDTQLFEYPLRIPVALRHPFPLVGSVKQYPSQLQQVQLKNHITSEQFIPVAPDAARAMKPARKRRRPPFSYSSLIAQAIQSTPDQKMTLKQIYQWITDKYPALYKEEDTGWQNTIRHNLSLNQCFKKVPKKDSGPQNKGKGGYWTIDSAYMDHFSNGAFARGSVTKRKPGEPNVLDESALSSTERHDRSRKQGHAQGSPDFRHQHSSPVLEGMYREEVMELRVEGMQARKRLAISSIVTDDGPSVHDGSLNLYHLPIPSKASTFSDSEHSPTPTEYAISQLSISPVKASVFSTSLPVPVPLSSHRALVAVNHDDRLSESSRHTQSTPPSLSSSPLSSFHESSRDPSVWDSDDERGSATGFGRTPPVMRIGNLLN